MIHYFQLKFRTHFKISIFNSHLNIHTWLACLFISFMRTAQPSLPGLHVHTLASSWQQPNPVSLVYMFTLLHHRGNSPTQSPWSTCSLSCIIVATEGPRLPGLHWRACIIVATAGPRLPGLHWRAGINAREARRNIWKTLIAIDMRHECLRRGDYESALKEGRYSCLSMKDLNEKSYYVANFGDLYAGVTQRNIEGCDKFWNAIIGTWKTVPCQIMRK